MTESTVSVLALSSRFDGQISRFSLTLLIDKFQYSLCRVVLMVSASLPATSSRVTVSVLALSSRFDGLCQGSRKQWGMAVSVLALSSRFDGLDGVLDGAGSLHPFQYSLCRVVLMVKKIR